MIVTRLVKIQLVVFVVLSLLGLGYLGVTYVGLDEKLFDPPYRVRVQLASTGGIFENAEVTYRGVLIGRVEKVDLSGDGVAVDLRLEAVRKVPSNVVAVVANRSAVGEQYVDLQPAADGPPYLRDGGSIAQAQTRTPLPPEEMLLHLDQLVGSVDTSDLQVVAREMAAAFGGTGPDLQRFIDSGIELTELATDSLTDTVSLIEQGKTVLATQIGQATSIQTFAENFALLSRQFRDSDPDLRRLLATGPAAAAELTDLIELNRENIGRLLRDFIVMGQISDRRLAGIEQLLVIFPKNNANGDIARAHAPEGWAPFSAHLGGEPPVCTEGYEGTTWRTPHDTTDRPANTDARCSLEYGSESSVRGSGNAPGPR